MLQAGHEGCAPSSATNHAYLRMAARIKLGPYCTPLHRMKDLYLSCLGVVYALIQWIVMIGGRNSKRSLSRKAGCNAR